MIPSYNEFLQLEESKGIPEKGEIVAFEDRFKTKLYKNSEDTNGKQITIEPNEEFEVVDSEDQIILKTKGGVIRLEKKEYKDLGAYLV